MKRRILLVDDELAILIQTAHRRFGLPERAPKPQEAGLRTAGAFFALLDEETAGNSCAGRNTPRRPQSAQLRFRRQDAPAAAALRCWKHSRQNTGRPWVGLNGTVVSLPQAEHMVRVSTLE